jgi:hypothetical protein
MRNNSTNISFWKNIKQGIFTILKVIQKNLTSFSTKYPRLSEVIQLTFIYYFAVVDLLYGILSNVFALGYFPEILRNLYPTIKSILTNPLFQMWNSPEKIFFLSYLAIEIIVVRPVFKFSKLVKYNVLLIFALLMLQGLVISYWDLLFHREIASSVAKWIFDDSGFIYTDKFLSILLFLCTFVLFMCLYIYLYILALNGKFATFSGMQWLTDSIAFWLKIKTPTMRMGFRRKNKGNKDQ